MTTALGEKKNSVQGGYYSSPALYENQVLFVSEGDLWHVSTQGGIAERRTCGLGAVDTPHFSPNGAWIAFTGTQEGHQEVYLMPILGGIPQRLTFFDQTTVVLGWTLEGEILFKSNHGAPFSQSFSLYTLPMTGGEPQKLSTGFANAISFHPQTKGCVIQRHGYGYINWKRYRGGTAGELWIDSSGTGKFEKLLNLESNNLQPLWIQNRIYFLSDHEGHGNIYSCTPLGEDLRRHTDAKNFYVRQISQGAGCGDSRIIYKEGADLKILQVDTGRIEEIPIIYPSVFPEKTRFFSNPTRHLSAFDLSPEGKNLLITTRGRLFSFKPSAGPVHQQGDRHGIRYRLGRWLSKSRWIAVKDKGLSEILEIFEGDLFSPSKEICCADWGRILDISVSPKENAVLLTNHRHELWHVDLESAQGVLLDQSTFGTFQGMDWSPDATWIVYSVRINHSCSILRLIHLKTLKKTDITTPLFQDFHPRFDSEGRFIYFLSFRTLHLERDALKFDWAFKEGVKPYLITLQKNTTSPFILPPEEEEEEDKEEEGGEKTSKGKKKDTAPPPLAIDLDGICDRLLPFPVPAESYETIQAHGDKIFWLVDCEEKEEKSLKEEADPSKGGEIQFYDLTTLKLETLIGDVKAFTLSRNGQWLSYVSSDRKIRVLKAGEKPEEHDSSYRAGGWVDEERIRLEVDPKQEWLFMFEEAWRLQKELFWCPEMGKIDWNQMLKRYLPLVDRVSTTAELMDVIFEMQGELGVSHAYTWGYPEGFGDPYPLGNLGATFKFDASHKTWRIDTLAHGDTWDPEISCPLLKPGLNVKEGTILWSIDGVLLSEFLSPAQALVFKAHHTVSLTISDSFEAPKRTIWVRPLAKVTPIHYRDWVNGNRQQVTEKTQGRVGYIHIPDMGEEGFCEFFRSYMQEFDKEGLIIDVRFNRGGHISSLLLSVLTRKRLGFDQSRWENKIPYLMESPRGPMVALCNELTASDGDMFAYSFKALQMGPLIGKRTWGGVIGIFPRHPLLDGSMTSQPEYAIWFHDIGWRLENRGAEPDILVENTPQEEVKGLDSQLERGIQEILKKMNEAK